MQPRRLHVNLGHCSKPELLRILRHAGARPSVMEFARDFECDACKSLQKPKIVNPIAPPKNLPPLTSIVLDIKHLQGWLPDQRIRAMNITCEPSGLQRVTPFEGREDGKTLREIYKQSWTLVPWLL